MRIDITTRRRVVPQAGALNKLERHLHEDRLLVLRKALKFEDHTRTEHFHSSGC